MSETQKSQRQTTMSTRQIACTFLPERSQVYRSLDSAQGQASVYNNVSHTENHTDARESVFERLGPQPDQSPDLTRDQPQMSGKCFPKNVYRLCRVTRDIVHPYRNRDSPKPNIHWYATSYPGTGVQLAVRKMAEATTAHVDNLADLRETLDHTRKRKFRADGQGANKISTKSSEPLGPHQLKRSCVESETSHVTESRSSSVRQPQPHSSGRTVYRKVQMTDSDRVVISPRYPVRLQDGSGDDDPSLRQHATRESSAEESTKIPNRRLSAQRSDWRTRCQKAQEKFRAEQRWDILLSRRSTLLRVLTRRSEDMTTCQLTDKVSATSSKRKSPSDDDIDDYAPSAKRCRKLARLR